MSFTVKKQTLVIELIQSMTGAAVNMQSNAIHATLKKYASFGSDSHQIKLEMQEF